MSRIILIYKTVYPLERIQQIRDRCVMVERIDDVCDILAHVAADIIRLFEELRHLVHKVRSEHLADDPLLICIIKHLKTLGEQTEGRGYEDPLGLALLKLP